MLALIDIGLGVGLEVGLRSDDDASTTTEQPPPESYQSRKGAWNGSGFSLTDQGYILHVYFQHHSGDLTWMYLNVEWYGNSTYAIATDARNDTPVSAVTYVAGAMEFVRIFCKVQSS